MGKESCLSKRLKTIAKKEDKKCNLPEEMARFANKLFEEYTLDRDIQKKLLAETLVPRNLDKIKQVDDFIILILWRTKPYLTNDSSLEKF